MLDRVQRRPLRRQHRAGITPKAHKIRSSGNLLSFFHQQVDFHRGIERTEERDGNRQTGHDDCVTAIHRAVKPDIRRDNALRCNVGSRWPQIFGKRRADKGVEIKMGKGKGHVSAVRRFLSDGVAPTHKCVRTGQQCRNQ